MTQKDQEPPDQAVPSDMETSKLPACQSEPTVTESLPHPGAAPVNDQPATPDQRIPDKDSNVSNAAPDPETSVTLNEFVSDKVTEDTAEPGPVTTTIEQVILA